MQIHVIFTCHNRAEKTKNCIVRLIEGNPSLDFRFTVVNDGSTDGTDRVLAELNGKYHCITEIKGDGSLFYSKGMRRGMDSLNASGEQPDYVLLVNDDVDFAEHVVEKMIGESQSKSNAIIVGATHDENGNLSYGGAKYKPGTVDCKVLTCEQSDIPCSTFNANCVLIPWELYSSVPPMDDTYVHSMGDFDYGLSLSRAGAMIYTSGFYVGKCNRNPIKGTWYDTSLSKMERFRKKETPRGLPLGSWLHYLNKNFGLRQAILHGFTPYIKILLGKR